MTPEHLEKLHRARRERAAKLEKKIQKYVNKIVPRMDPESRRKITYIHKQINSGVREDGDVKLLKSVRTDILRRYDKEAKFDE